MLLSLYSLEIDGSFRARLDASGLCGIEHARASGENYDPLPLNAPLVRRRKPYGFVSRRSISRMQAPIPAQFDMKLGMY